MMDIFTRYEISKSVMQISSLHAVDTKLNKVRVKATKDVTLTMLSSSTIYPLRRDHIKFMWPRICQGMMTSPKKLNIYDGKV